MLNQVYQFFLFVILFSFNFVDYDTIFCILIKSKL